MSWRALAFINSETSLLLPTLNGVGVWVALGRFVRVSGGLVALKFGDEGLQFFL